MSLGRVDARFLLPFAPERAAVLAGAEGWREGLRQAGVDTEGEDPELVVAATEELAPAGAMRARALLLEGNRTRAPAGYHARRFVPLPSLERPSLLVPVDRGNVARYVFENWLFPTTRARLVRKRLLVSFARPALALLRRPSITIATTNQAQPFLVAAAAERFALDPDADWFVVCGQGDELSRGLFVLFARHAGRPSWVVKFSRARGYSEPFERDEAALATVAAAGGAVAQRAPSFLGRFETAGFQASVETAAVGSRLTGLLQSVAPRSKKLSAIDAVAAWLVRVAVETERGAGSAAAEAERLRREVLPKWETVADEAVLDEIDMLPGVLQHNDLGAWNVVVDRDGDFTAVDWESASACGLPLWDLWYFLADALVQLDGYADGQVSAFARLFRGEARSSQVLFRWTRAAVDALGIPEHVVGCLATLCWLHHGLSVSTRADSLARHAGGAAATAWAAAGYPEAWLGEAALGFGWSRWR